MQVLPRVRQDCGSARRHHTTPAAARRVKKISSSTFFSSFILPLVLCCFFFFLASYTYTSLLKLSWLKAATAGHWLVVEPPIASEKPKRLTSNLAVELNTCELRVFASSAAPAAFLYLRPLSLSLSLGFFFVSFGCSDALRILRLFSSAARLRPPLPFSRITCPLLGAKRNGTELHSSIARFAHPFRPLLGGLPAVHASTHPKTYIFLLWRWPLKLWIPDEQTAVVVVVFFLFFFFFISSSCKVITSELPILRL